MQPVFPWHHTHITVPERQTAAEWHAANTPAERVTPTKRSENLVSGANLLQIQSQSVAAEPRWAWIDAVGISVDRLESAIDAWRVAGGTVQHATAELAFVIDPWGTSFELIEGDPGYSHVSVIAEEPEILKNWYCENLGGTEVECGWDSTRSAIAFDTMRLTFAQALDPLPLTTRRVVDHLGWYCVDLGGRRIIKKNKRVNFPIAPREFGKVRLAFAEDPAGLWIELVQPSGEINK
jgi:hypothetical protein